MLCSRRKHPRWLWLLPLLPQRRWPWPRRLLPLARQNFASALRLLRPPWPMRHHRPWLQLLPRAPVFSPAGPVLSPPPPLENPSENQISPSAWSAGLSALSSALFFITSLLNSPAGRLASLASPSDFLPDWARAFSVVNRTATN